jgi:hypothetical protein
VSKPEHISVLSAQMLAHLVAKEGGPADPDDLERSIYQETVEATGIDPTEQK